MRPIGKRSIAFGLVSVPVKIYTATEDHDIALHQVHDADGGRIRYERRCEVCGKVVPYQHIDKGYEEGGRRVILDDEDLERLPEASRDDIEVVEFVPSEQVDPISFERSYYLEPERSGVKAYILLRRTLERTDRTAIVRFALRTKTHLGALRVHGDALVLQSLLWSDELRKADFPVLEGSPRISAKEQQLADALVTSLESDFRPDDYRDEYQDQLRELIDAKLERGDAIDIEDVFPEEEGAPEAGEVIDLMEALRRSVDRGRTAERGRSASRKASEASEASEATPEGTGRRTRSRAGSRARR